MISYVARGTFSLPVGLPELGGVTLDFARPSGDAELSLWAVREDSIDAAWGTFGILVALAVAAVLYRMLARRTGNGWPAIPWAVWGLYALALLLGTSILGLVGLAAALMAVAVLEWLRRRRRGAAKT